MFSVKVDPSGWPFVGGAAGIAVMLWAFNWALWAIPAAILTLGFLFFFRDPERQVPAEGRDVVLSPADGRVLVAGEAALDAAPPGLWRQISIFLSPLDVHVNRVPVTGRVTRIERRRGRYLPAYRADAAARNEHSEVWVESDGRVVVFRQIVGVLARRVVCRLKQGQTVQAGERFGIMKFGSRMDVFVPPEAALQVSVGDIVRGGETVLARL